MSVKSLVAKKSTAGALTGAALVKRINTLHADCERAVGDAANLAMQVGDLLIQAKKQCPRGEWENWVEENCPFSYRSARTYMRLAKHRPMIEANGHTGASLTINQSKKLIAGPSRPRPDDRPIEAEAPTDIPDLAAGGIFAACGSVGEFVAVLQIEESKRSAGYWHTYCWNLGTDETIVSMRAVRLTSTCPEEMSDREWFEMATAADFDGVPFVRRGPWKAFDRETAPCPLANEAVQDLAYRIYKPQQRAATYAAALEMAAAELEVVA